jgi:glycosyltransferase involved in cell wall biosynthesis
LLDEKLVIGDIYDKFTAPSWDCVSPEYIQAIKKKQDLMLKKSDIVFAVSQELFNEISKEHPYVHLIPNGVDYESFTNSTQHESPERIKRLSKPLLGFLGMLHYIVDFELLDYIAESHPEWTLLLMGRDNIHVDADREVFNKLKKRKNIIWLGEVDRIMIPSFLRAIDIGLLPQKKLEVNRYATAPLKVWEYFAAGKPIVAVDQGVTPEYSDLIRYADSKIEFETNIAKALKEDISEELVERRKNIAKENSWPERIDQMIGIIEEKLRE